MYPFLSGDFITPINCVLQSEEISSVRIKLNKRFSKFLKGELYKNNKILGTFKTMSPKANKPASWSFENGHQIFKGEMLLFKNNILWNSYQSRIKSEEINRVIFTGLNSQIKLILNDFETLKATAGFFEIGSECYGGRINKI